MSTDTPTEPKTPAAAPEILTIEPEILTIEPEILAGDPEILATAAETPAAEAATTPNSAEAALAGAVEMPFQAEVQQVLGLVINSLYTHKEVFLRELISNAADALDKARFLQLTRTDVTEQVGEPRISISLDLEGRILTIEDNGVGMTRDEVIENLGTIARSGSLDFLKANVEAANAKGSGLNIIGQFGVGFYAAFMVASRVDVSTLSMQPGAEPVLWRSHGAGNFSVAPGKREHPGTQIVLHLKDDARDYGRSWRVKEIIRKYSDFVHFPIFLDNEQANRSRALWTLPKSQVTEEQHLELFRHVTHTGEDDKPLLTIHWAVDAPVQFHALLYVPGKAPADMLQRERKGLRLYAKRVLIMEDCEKLTPQYLRFTRGVVDSEDLSLNVSREMLQDNKLLTTIEQQIVKQVLKALKELADTDAEKYLKFYKEYGRALKEGIAMDWKNIDAIAELCRFESMNTEAGKLISLREYIAAMPEAQKDLYYVTGLGRRAVERSPHLEAFRKRGWNVLFFVDPVDEWMVKSLVNFDKKRLQSVAHGDLDLGPEPETEKKDEDADVSGAVEAVKKALGERVKDVRVSKRLTDSASVLVAQEGDPGANFERMIRMVNENGTPETRRILELNPTHPIVKNIATLAARDPESPNLTEWSELLFDQALLSEGVVLDPAKLVKRIQEMFTQVSNAAVSIV